MSTSSPSLVEGKNLSNTWLQVLATIACGSGMEITPLVLSITNFEESSKVREALDANLSAKGKQPIQTVADTIFPSSVYEYCVYDRHRLYQEFMEILPRIKKIEPKKNGRGTYFERLIAFDGNTNQLEIIISSFQKDKSVRRSALQASIFDPRKDHIKDPYQGFPCLQHVTFYVDEQKGLVLNSFYAIQYLYQKAYGNWLGLINLGKFMAREMGLTFNRLNCFVGVEQLDILKKEEAKTLLASLS